MTVYFMIAFIIFLIMCGLFLVVDFVKHDRYTDQEIRADKYGNPKNYTKFGKYKGMS